MPGSAVRLFTPHDKPTRHITNLKTTLQACDNFFPDISEEKYRIKLHLFEKYRELSSWLCFIICDVFLQFCFFECRTVPKHIRRWNLSSLLFVISCFGLPVYLKANACVKFLWSLCDCFLSAMTGKITGRDKQADASCNAAGTGKFLLFWKLPIEQSCNAGPSSCTAYCPLFWQRAESRG